MILWYCMVFKMPVNYSKLKPQTRSILNALKQIKIATTKMITNSNVYSITSEITFMLIK